MTTTVLKGGLVFDGTGSPAAVQDVAFADGRVVAVGQGLVGDSVVDCTGKTVIPGLIDCHVHFMVNGNFSPAAHGQTPFSYHFYAAPKTCARPLRLASPPSAKPAPDLGVKEAQERGAHHRAGACESRSRS
ncbi:MAG: hypothetical protein R2706_02340 [Acidimicrobiales bacterium]